MEEQLMVLNEDGTPSGEVVDRTEAHAEGYLHGTSQVFVYKIENGQLYFLLQKRCADKDSFPNCWDISCAGHVPAHMSYLENAVKELEEELGLRVAEDLLVPVFLHKTEKRAVFYGKPFIDRQYSMVYRLYQAVPEDEIVFQKEEISAVKWFSYADILVAIDRKDESYCLNREKFERVYDSIRKDLRVVHNPPK